MLEYIYSEKLEQIKKEFDTKIKNEGGKIKDLDDAVIKNVFYGLFDSQKFIDLYKELALEVATSRGLQISKSVLQPKPTPRIYPPKAHGTSWHTDYLYGHGKKSLTVWVPIHGVQPGSTFSFVSNQLENDRILKKIYRRPEFILGDVVEKKYVSQVLPAVDEVAIFDSNQLHSSVENTSQVRRLSFDFRIAETGDRTSSKNLSEYLSLEKRDKSISQANEFKFLKYIVGGRGFDTASQHILIEGVARHKNYKIAGQEAEIERLGLTMLSYHLDAVSLGESKFNAIIVSSKSLFSEQELKYIERRSSSHVYFGAENEWV